MADKRKLRGDSWVEVTKGDHKGDTGRVKEPLPKGKYSVELDWDSKDAGKKIEVGLDEIKAFPSGDEFVE